MNSKSMTSLSDIYNLVVDNYVRKYNTSETARELWLDKNEPIELRGNVVVLAIDSEMKMSTLSQIYLSGLEEQFSIVLGTPIKIELFVKNNPETTEKKFDNIRNSEELTNQIDNIVHDNKVTYTFDTFIVGPCLYTEIPALEKLTFFPLSRMR